MPWYLAVYNFILTFCISVSISVVRIVKLFAARVRRNIAPTPLIELPVTSPTPLISYIAVARGHAQRFVVAPLTILLASVHNLARRISYTIVWHTLMYMHQIAKSFHFVRVAVVKFFVNGLLCLVRAIHDTSEHPVVWITKNYEVEPPNPICDSVSNKISSHVSVGVPAWQGYQNYALTISPGYVPLSNISTINLDQTAASTSNDTSIDTTPTLASGADLSPDSNWGLTPSDSFFCSESASSQSSLTTPSQSPDQAFFNDLALACKGIDNFNMDMDITEGDMDNDIPLAAIMEERDKLKAKLSAKGLDSSSASINSFGQIERLFEDNYGKSVSLAADDFFSSLGKQVMAPPAPITVFSASVYYDASLRSSLNVRLNALVSGNNSTNSSLEGICTHDTVMEDDITTASVDAEHCFLDPLVLTVDNFIVEDVSSPNSNRSSFELSAAFSAQDKLMEEDISVISAMNSPLESFQCDEELSPHESILSIDEISDSALSSRNSLARSSVIIFQGVLSPSQDSQCLSSEPSSVQTSAVCSPLCPFDDPLSPAIAEAGGLLYDHPISSPDPSNTLSLSLKKANRRARVTSGLAIDIRALSPSIISSVEPPSPAMNVNFDLPMFSIPSIIVSPVSEDASSMSSRSPELGITDLISQSITKRNEIPREIQPTRVDDKHGSVPAPEYSVSSQTGHCTQNACVAAAYRSPSRTAVRDSASRRVGLRGSLPRYRFSTLPDLAYATTDTNGEAPPDSRSLNGAPTRSDRRVGLLGTAPRQRFPPTLSPPPISAVARLARAAHEARERAAVLERHRARAQFFAQRDAAHGSGLRPLLLPLSVAARDGNMGGVPGKSASSTRFWGVPF